VEKTWNFFSGTEKQQVAFDYELQLDVGIKSCQDVVNKGFTRHTNGRIIQFCDLLNISQCAITENNKEVRAFGISWTIEKNTQLI